MKTRYYLILLVVLLAAMLSWRFIFFQIKRPKQLHTMYGLSTEEGEVLQDFGRLKRMILKKWPSAQVNKEKTTGSITIVYETLHLHKTSRIHCSLTFEMRAAITSDNVTQDAVDVLVSERVKVPFGLAFMIPSSDLEKFESDICSSLNIKR